MTGHWLDTAAPSARCVHGDRVRASAQRLFVTHATPSAALRQAAGAVLAKLADDIGRVIGAGSFADAVVQRHLQAALPQPLASALRPTFEWYGCRGAHFHNDAHYGDVLFGAWYVRGDPRDLVFPRAGWRVAIAPGDAVVFDPFEPHAVLLPGANRYARESYVGTAPSLFVAFELELDAAAMSLFGVSSAAPPGAATLSSAVPVRADDGTTPAV